MKRPNASAQPEHRASGEVTALTVARAGPPVGKKKLHGHSNASLGPANRIHANAPLATERPNASAQPEQRALAEGPNTVADAADAVQHAFVEAPQAVAEAAKAAQHAFAEGLHTAADAADAAQHVFAEAPHAVAEAVKAAQL